MTDNKSGEILIIEDDKDINDLLATALSKPDIGQGRHGQAQRESFCLSWKGKLMRLCYWI